jgi:hypothetical protein
MVTLFAPNSAASVICASNVERVAVQ